MLKGKISLWNRSGIFSSMLALLLCIAMCFECVPFYTVAAEETEETGTYKTKAISWLVGEKDDVSGWGDTDLINDTANALTILGREGKPTDSTFLEKWKGSHKDMNTDEMVHIARAEYMSADSKEAESLLSDIMSRQNPDGVSVLQKNMRAMSMTPCLHFRRYALRLWLHRRMRPQITAARQETQHSTLRGNRKATEGMRTRMHLTAHRI